MKKRLLLSLLIISFCFISIGCSLLGVSSTPTVSPKPTPEFQNQDSNNQLNTYIEQSIESYEQYRSDKRYYKGIGENPASKVTEEYKSKAKEHISVITKNFTLIKKETKGKDQCSDPVSKLTKLIDSLSGFQADENYSGGFDFLEKGKFKKLHKATN